jgi:uncharacterized protein YcfL
MTFHKTCQFQSSNVKSQVSNLIFHVRHASRSRALVVAAVVFISMFTGGCKSTDIAPSAGTGDPYPAPLNDPQISILSPELRNWLGFQPAVIIKDGKRPMTVEVPVRNLTYNQYLIEYRFKFYDENGQELEPIMGWKFQSLDPKQIERLKGSALTTDAQTYRLEVRWSR